MLGARANGNNVAAPAAQSAAPAPAAPAAPEQTPSGINDPFGLLPNVTPQGAQIMANFKAHTFGSGLPGAAYKAGGAVTDLGATLGLPPQASAGLGYLTNLGVQSIPVLMSGRMAQTAGTPIIQSGATKLMQSAVKPTLADLRTGDAARAINTMLEQGYNPTMGGALKMQSNIDDLAAQVKDAIANSPASVDKYAVASRLSNFMQQARMQANPNADTAAIAKSWNEFLDSLPGTDIPVQTAQAIKQGTYSALGNKAYGEQMGATTEAQKQLARGLKEEIAQAVPEVGPLNQKMADLINAHEIITRRALMSGNRNPLSLAPLAAHPGGFLAFLADKSDLAKALLARSLYSSASPISYGTGALIGAVPGALSGMPPDQGILAR